MRLEEFRESARLGAVFDGESIGAIFRAFGELPAEELFSKALRWKKEPVPIIRNRLGLGDRDCTLRELFSRTCSMADYSLDGNEPESPSDYGRAAMPIEYFSQIGKGYLNERGEK
ncbi:MAG: hypothetical protein IJ806_01190 [Ruminococcus sp.]|nr:hypothetical protein [Ruminococcus sp.]MBR1862688.1 hypothetical protein [Ruminococcus sp.]